MSDDPTRLLNLDEVAARLGFRSTRVKRMYSSGKIPLRQVGRHLVMSVGEFDAWIDSISLAQTAKIVPLPSLQPRFTLYRFFDAEDVLLYVGITTIGVARWHHHASTQPWWPEVATIRIEHRASAEDLRTAELEAIRTEQPRYNIKDMPR